MPSAMAWHVGLSSRKFIPPRYAGVHVDRYDCALAWRLPGESTVPGNAEAPRIGGYILVLQRRSIVDHHFSRPASPRNQGTFAGRDHKILDLAAPSERRPDDESENIVDEFPGCGPNNRGCQASSARTAE